MFVARRQRFVWHRVMTVCHATFRKRWFYRRDCLWSLLLTPVNRDTQSFNTKRKALSEIFAREFSARDYQRELRIRAAISVREKFDIIEINWQKREAVTVSYQFYHRAPLPYFTPFNSNTPATPNSFSLFIYSRRTSRRFFFSFSSRGRPAAISKYLPIMTISINFRWRREATARKRPRRYFVLKKWSVFILTGTPGTGTNPSPRDVPFCEKPGVRCISILRH